MNNPYNKVVFNKNPVNFPLMLVFLLPVHALHVMSCLLQPAKQYKYLVGFLILHVHFYETLGPLLHELS